MSSVTLVTKEGKLTVPDPEILFQRFISTVLLGKTLAISQFAIDDLLSHELCPSIVSTSFV